MKIARSRLRQIIKEELILEIQRPCGVDDYSCPSDYDLDHLGDWIAQLANAEIEQWRPGGEKSKKLIALADREGVDFTMRDYQERFPAFERLLKTAPINVFSMSGGEDPDCRVPPNDDGCFKAYIPAGGSDMRDDPSYWGATMSQWPEWFGIHLQADAYGRQWLGAAPRNTIKHEMEHVVRSAIFKISGIDIATMQEDELDIYNTQEKGSHAHEEHGAGDWASGLWEIHAEISLLADYLISMGHGTEAEPFSLSSMTHIVDGIDNSEYQSPENIDIWGPGTGVKNDPDLSRELICWEDYENRIPCMRWPVNGRGYQGVLSNLGGDGWFSAAMVSGIQDLMSRALSNPESGIFDSINSIASSSPAERPETFTV